MKRFTMLLCALFLLSWFTGVANAGLVTIGTANYNGSDYNLIWDNDNNGNSLVWLDDSNPLGNWYKQVNWVTDLNSSLTISLDAGYTVDWGVNPWRLPTTVDDLSVWGFDGTTTAGYNITNSEMGHLFYEELGNLGYSDKSGSSPQPGWGLQNTGDFDNLKAASPSWYGSDTTYRNPSYEDYVWAFGMHEGSQGITTKSSNFYGLAVRSGQVSASSVPSVPEPGTLLLVVMGLTGFASLGRRKGRRA